MTPHHRNRVPVLLLGLLALTAVTSVPASHLTPPDYPDDHSGSPVSTPIYETSTAYQNVNWNGQSRSLGSFEVANATTQERSNRTHILELAIHIQFVHNTAGIGRIDLQVDGTDVDALNCIMAAESAAGQVLAPTLAVLLLAESVAHTLHCEAPGLAPGTHTVGVMTNIISGNPTQIAILNLGLQVHQIDYDVIPMTTNTALDIWLPILFWVGLLIYGSRRDYYILMGVSAFGLISTLLLQEFEVDLGYPQVFLMALAVAAVIIESRVDKHQEAT